MQNWAVRILLWGSGLTVFAVGFIGLLHVPTVRARLMRAGITWGCPMPKADPVATEAAFRHATQQRLGSEPTRVRPAGGLALGSMTAADATSWLAARGVSCTTKDRGFHYVRCENVPSTVLGEEGPSIESLTLVFGRSDRLVSVDVWRSHLSSTDGVNAYDDLVAKMQGALGSAGDRAGQPTTAALDLPLGQASSEYRYSNYLAKLTVANIPGKGVAVREQFTDVSTL